MAKRRKVDKSGFTDSGLPTPHKAEQATAEATDTTPPKRQAAITAKGRAKFTTMLNIEIRDKLQETADRNAVSIADVLDHILRKHYKLEDKKPDFS